MKSGCRSSKDAAANEFKANTLRVAHEALELVGHVNHAFVTLQAEIENQRLMQQTLQAAQSGHLLAEKQFAAGNITELTLGNERASYAQIQLQQTQSDLRVAGAHERLTRLLGLWGKRAGWEISESLPRLPSADVLPEHPEAMAIRQRLDLEAARLHAGALADAVGLAQSTRYFGRIDVGVHYHQDPDGPRLLGPTLVLELPIFDQRQAYIARLEAELKAASRRVSALAVDARSRVREGLLALQAARAAAQYFDDTLVPLRETIVEQSQLHYNGMLLGLYQLLAAKEASLDSRRSAITARRDYWIARFELESALGSALPAEKGPP